MYPSLIDTDLNCLVFSTNVDTDLKASRLEYVLEKTSGIASWNLDMEDRDHVLRIDFKALDLSLFEGALSSFGIVIEELPIW